MVSNCSICERLEGINYLQMIARVSNQFNQLLFGTEINGIWLIFKWKWHAGCFFLNQTHLSVIEILLNNSGQHQAFQLSLSSAQRKTCEIRDVGSKTWLFRNKWAFACQKMKWHRNGEIISPLGYVTWEEEGVGEGGTNCCQANVMLIICGAGICEALISFNETCPSSPCRYFTLSELDNKTLHRCSMSLL